MITLIVGGARSGKSDQGLDELCSYPEGKNYFLATCPRLDSEINERIEKHVQERASLNIETIEEQTELATQLSSLEDNSNVLLDCLTLWVNNLMYHAGLNEKMIKEQDILFKIEEIMKICSRKRINLICVTNEVGMGLVPSDAQNRLYRDLVGKCNRAFAAAADKVLFVSCGIPLILKG